MAKRKRASLATTPAGNDFVPPSPTLGAETATKKPTRQQLSPSMLDPDETSQVIDGPDALRASPDSAENSPLSDAPPEVEPPTKKHQSNAKKATPKKDDKMDEMMAASAARKIALQKQQPAAAEGQIPRDPEADDDDAEADPEELREALSRPPPVNSDYLPLPWKGRLGYACLCTYLRYSNPPVFQSRTTRIASILEHRHPLKDPSQPEHATKNRPDKDQAPDVRRGQEFVEKLCRANVKDMIKMLRWNDKYNIKFLRLSSEAFPFASHAEYGYRLAPFATEALAEVGKVAAELGHRLTTHPGQFTQLGSPRPEVITASIRDLEYHEELLSLLKLPEQQDRDAVMILHMGGMFGDKEATLNRFRENYQKLSPGIKKRLVLENDDVVWNVHDLLPICKELNIPFVLDFHHHNILFNPSEIREGTKDIMELYPEIIETWRRKGITPKMHYSEQTPAAITGKQRRKHNPRPATLPPCPNDMDLMIEAKDKEQAVFELMRTFKLPGFDSFSDMLPHVRRDDNKPVRIPKAKKPTKKGRKVVDEAEDIEEEEAEDADPTTVPEEEVGMGGPESRVYWPPGMEEWLRPVKKVVAKKTAPATTKPKTKEELKAAKAAKEAAYRDQAASQDQVKLEEAEIMNATVQTNGGKKETKKGRSAKPVVGDDIAPKEADDRMPDKASGVAPKQAPRKRKSGTASKKVKPEPTPTSSSEGEDFTDGGAEVAAPSLKRAASSRKSSRARPSAVSYKEEEDGD